MADTTVHVRYVLDRDVSRMLKELALDEEVTHGQAVAQAIREKHARLVARKQEEWKRKSQEGGHAATAESVQVEAIKPAEVTPVQVAQEQEPERSAPSASEEPAPEPLASRPGLPAPSAGGHHVVGGGGRIWGRPGLPSGFKELPKDGR